MNRPPYPPEAQAQATYRPPPFRPRAALPPPTRHEPSHPPGWIRPPFKLLIQPTTSADYPPQGPVLPRPLVAPSHDQPTFHSANPTTGPVGSLDPGFSWHPQASTLRDQAPPLSVTSHLAVREPPRLPSGPGSFPQRQRVSAPRAHGHDGRPHISSGAASQAHGKSDRPWDQRDRAPEPRLPPLQPPPPPPPPPPPARSEAHVAGQSMAIDHTKVHPQFSPPLMIAQYQLKIFKDNHTRPVNTMSLEQRLEAKRIIIALLEHRVPSRVIIGWGVDQELVLESANELKQAAPPPRSEDVHVAPVVAHNPVPSSTQVPYQQRRQHDVVQVQPQHQLEQRTQQFERQAPLHLPQRPPPPQQQQRQPYQQPVHDLVEGQRQARTQPAPPLDYDPLNPSATLPKTQLASFSFAPSNSQAQPFQPKHLPKFSSTASVESSTNQHALLTPATVRQSATSHQPTQVVHATASAQPSSSMNLSIKRPSTESTNAAEIESKKAPTLPRPTSRTQAQVFRVTLASSKADPLAARFSYRAGVNDVLKGAFPASSSSQPHVVESFPYERLRKPEAVRVTHTPKPSVEGWTPDSALLSSSSELCFFGLGGSSTEYVELEEGDVTVTVDIDGTDVDVGGSSVIDSTESSTVKEGDTYSHLPGYENVRLSSLVRSSHHPYANVHPDVPELDTDTTGRSEPSSSAPWTDAGFIDHTGRSEARSSAPSTASESDSYIPPPCHEDDDYIGFIHGHPRTVDKLIDVQDSLAASQWAADWARDRAGFPRGTESVKSADIDDKAKGKVDKGKRKAADIGAGIEAELETQTKEDVAVLPENGTDGRPGDLAGDDAVKRAEPHVCVKGSECPRYAANHPADCVHGPWHPRIVCQDYAERLGCSKLQNGNMCLDVHVPLEVSRKQPPGWCPQGKECKSRRNGRCLTKMWGLVPGKKTHQ